MPKKALRQEVPTLTDVEPKHRQLEDYYLLRQERDIYHAPLEWRSPDQPASREFEPDEPKPDFDQQAERTASHRLMKNSMRGSKPFTGSELRCGYRKV